MKAQNPPDPCAHRIHGQKISTSFVLHDFRSSEFPKNTATAGVTLHWSGGSKLHNLTTTSALVLHDALLPFVSSHYFAEMRS